MSIAEKQVLDLSLILYKTDELGNAMLKSVEVAEYLFWKERVSRDEEVKALIRKMDKAKERFQDCERFGHYHPDYHAALDEVKAVEAEMEQVKSIREFKKAEDALDRLLYDVSETIARSVSESVKVPSNDPHLKSGCGSGGCSSCG